MVGRFHGKAVLQRGVLAGTVPETDRLRWGVYPRGRGWREGGVRLFGLSHKSLILGAGGGIIAGQDGQNPIEFMFTWQLQRKPIEEIAIWPEPGAVIGLDLGGKVLASNNFGKPLHLFVPIHLATLIHEQPFVFDC